MTPAPAPEAIEPQQPQDYTQLYGPRFEKLPEQLVNALREQIKDFQGQEKYLRRREVMRDRRNRFYERGFQHERFRENYARARQYWAESEFERMMQIADTPMEGVKTRTTKDGLEVTTGDMTDHRRLQVDTRKWALARMFPKKYGDATLLKHGDAEGNVLKVEVTRVVPNPKLLPAATLRIEPPEGE